MTCFARRWRSEGGPARRQTSRSPYPGGGDRILSYIGGLDEPRFLADTKTQDAVVRNFEIMGEAAKRLSEETRAAHPSVPWRDFARFRDVLIHQYDQVVPADVWRIATVELWAAIKKLRSAAKKLGLP